MKLTTADNKEGLVVKKYAMPRRGEEGTAKINGEEVKTVSTAGRGKEYTYFLYKNVSLYVEGRLEADADYELDVPDDFGAAEAPGVRASTYVSKKKPKNPDGSVPAGDSNAEGAPHTEVRDGVEVAVNPDGSLVSEDAQRETLEHGNNANDQISKEEDKSTYPGDGGEKPAAELSDTNPDGSPIEQPKPRSKKSK